MSERRTVETERTSWRPIRGGISPAAILTGVVVAFGAMFLLSALIGGVLVATGIRPTDVTTGAAEVGIGIAVAVLIAQFIAYLWGGYTAGRMGRGAGVANGLLVPLVAIVVAIVVAAIAAALGATANLNLPLQTARLPVEEGFAIDWGTGLGIALLVAMFLGGALGGIAGTRWHSRLETTAIEEREATERPATPAATTDEDRRPAETRTIRKPGAPAKTEDAHTSERT